MSAVRWFRPAAMLVFAVAIAASLTLPGRGGASTQSPVARSAAPATAIVVRAASLDALPSLEARAAALGYSSRRGDPALPALALRGPSGVSAARAMADFIAWPGVLYAEPAFTMAITDTPTDALFPRQTYLDKVSAQEAWDIETGSASVVVAVLDTGIDVTHPDLAGRIWTNTDEVPGNGIDDDGSGCVDDVRGCAFVSFDSGCEAAREGDIEDDSGHGTFVAGIIGANADGRGIVGVARGVTLMPVKVLDCNGSGISIDVTQGILYAARNGARVINVSLGTDGASAYLQEAVRLAHVEFGALVVAASGNTGGEGVIYPARYDSVLAVGAAAANGTSRAEFSTAGPEVDVVAIGQDVVGTVPPEHCERFPRCVSEEYAIASGTSFSAPQVSGLAALILSHRPFMTADAVAARIKATADPIPQSGVNWAGAGRINMAKALAPGFRLGVPGTTRD